MKDLYERCKATGVKIRAWQSDMFVEQTPETTQIFNEVNEPVGTYGRVSDSKGGQWYIFYDSFRPWYNRITTLVSDHKNPILALKARYREEAFNDGSYQKAVDSDLTVTVRDLLEKYTADKCSEPEDLEDLKITINVYEYSSLRDCMKVISKIHDDTVFAEAEYNLIGLWKTKRGFTDDDGKYAASCGYEGCWFMED